MRLQRNSNGQSVTLDLAAPLGMGGEARIYAVLSDGQLAAKVYHRPTEEQTRKLRAMLANPPETAPESPGQLAIAWPVDLLRAMDNGRRVVGYLMPRVSGMHPLFEFYNPLTRRQHHPLCNYLYLHRIARNLTAAVRSLHARGYVIGDINESNILVTETALVTLVDTDSFQVRDPESGALYRCPVGKPEYTPPELQGKTFLQTDRTPEQDLFGLAVLIFLLLTEGTHPFAGVYQGAGDPPSYDARILAGHFPYGTRRTPYRPMPTAPSLDILHPTVRQLFLRCFEDGHRNPQARPDAQTWQSALMEAESALVACSANAQHRYGSHLSACPWCERKGQLGGRDPFPSLEAVQRREHLPPALPRRAPRPRIRPAPTPPAPSPTPAYYAASVGGYAAPAAPALPPYLNLPSNNWSWAALLFALIALTPGMHVLAGVAAGILGVLGLRYAPQFAGSGRWMAGLSLASGTLTALAFLTVTLLQNWRPADVMTLAGHRAAVHSLAFSPDGQRLASGGDRAEDEESAGGEINLWNARTGEFLRSLAGAKGGVYGVAFSPDGKTLAAATNAPLGISEIKLWDARNGLYEPPLSEYHFFLRALAFSPDGHTLAAGGWQEAERRRTYGAVKLWDTRAGAVTQTFSVEDGADVFTVAFSPDGKLLAVGSGSSAVSGILGKVTVWDVATGRLKWTQTRHSTAVLCAAFSPDGKTLATVGNDNAIRLWEAQTGALRQTLESKGPWIAAVTFSPDGKILASGGSDRVVRLWNLQTGQVTRAFAEHSGPVYALAFSPDGKELASAGQDTTVVLRHLSAR
ncbi:MAG TPA: hypothetical protein VFB38_03650 [Chthonomonadaceae bacterium]|nr:hypothetical protein [Chthonomonadaceae bacterium]